MERGGGERKESIGAYEAPQSEQRVQSEPVAETRFAPIHAPDQLKPAPQTEAPPAIEDKDPTPADASARFSGEDIQRELPVDQLDGFEDRIIAGMEN